MISEKSLRSAAKELNEVLDLEPDINTKASVDKITEGIKEAIKDCIRPDDEFSDATQAVLDELAAELKKGKGKGKPATKKEEEPEDKPEDNDDAEEGENDDEENEPEEEEAPAPKKETKRVPPKRNPSGYSRTDAVCEGLKKKPKTIADWVKFANEAMVKNGGKANDSESRTIIKFVSTTLKYFGEEVKYPTA